MKKVKVYFKSICGIDEDYNRFIDLLMSVPNDEEWEIVDRKYDWKEYEIFEGEKYIVECELFDEEIEEMSKNGFRIEVVEE